MSVKSVCRGYVVSVVSDAPSSPYDVTHLDTFHEFTTEQENAWSVAKDFKPTGWTVRIDGLVEKPMVHSLEEIESRFNVEHSEIYRMRCIERIVSKAGRW